MSEPIYELTPEGRAILASLSPGVDDEVRARREARLLGPSPEAIRDMEVARATVRPKPECPHCNPSGDRA